MAKIYEDDYEEAFSSEDEFFTGGSQENGSYDYYGSEATAPDYEAQVPGGFEPPSDEKRNEFAKMNFFEVLAEFDSVIQTSKKYFFSKQKRVVNAKEISDIIYELNERTPDEIVSARDIISRRDSIIADANAEANETIANADQYDNATRAGADDYNAERHSSGDKYYDDMVKKGDAAKESIIYNAQQQAATMISEHAITVQATAEAARIKNENEFAMQNYWQTIHEKAKAYEEAINKWGVEAMTNVANYCANAYSTLLSSLEKATSDANINMNAIVQQLEIDIAKISSFNCEIDSYIQDLDIH